MVLPDNVLFFTRGRGKNSETGNTKETWVYDLRTNMPSFGKRTPLTLNHFKEFEKCYGKKPDGTSKRKHGGTGKELRGLQTEGVERHRTLGNARHFRRVYREKPRPRLGLSRDHPRH